ncbi:UMF1 family MFS transporter [Bacilli bacterium PM5-3]|nr:UMF1 family MFS transporter [Bacilli bacterium PM5-3]
MKLNKLEKNWVLYDVGNSAFIMLLSTIIPIYFKNIAFESGIDNATSTAYWGYALAISTLIIALLGPILGSLADNKGYKKTLFAIFMLLGTISCFCLGFFSNWVIFLIVIMIIRIGFNGSLIFYDSMLTDVSTDERMDFVSSNGYAWGYIGSCIPFIGCLVLILQADTIGLSTQLATAIAFIITSLWWFFFSVPLLKSYKQKYYVEHQENIAKESFTRLWKNLKKIKNDKVILTFLIAFFIYIDGVYTIIEMATSYGKDVGITDNNLLLALLLTQIIAFPAALIVGKLTSKYSSTQIISVSILGYLGIALFAIQLDKAWEFWLLAVCVAIFQGGIQALSRSYFAQLIPKNNSNEYFGIFDIFGKGATFMGTLMMGVITQVTNSSTNGVIGIACLFVLGFILFRYHLKVKKAAV